MRWFPLKCGHAAQLFIKNRENASDHHIPLFEYATHAKTVNQFTSKGCVQPKDKTRAEHGLH